MIFFYGKRDIYLRKRRKMRTNDRKMYDLGQESSIKNLSIKTCS